MTSSLDQNEEQNQDGFDIQRFLDIVRRRHMYFLIPLLIGWLGVWGAIWIIPARYKSVTLILVEQPTMPKDYVPPNVSENLQDRLRSITQQILSRTRLLLIIDKLHLYSEGNKQITPDEKVDLMRKDIEIELVQDKKNQEITAFNIYYSSHDPRIAQQVTRELTDLFIDENLKVRQEQSEGTTKFLGEQLENARKTLADQEEKIREFKMRHQGELPSQQASDLQILSGLQSQLQSEQNALNTARQQKVYFQSLIQQYQTVGGEGDTSNGTSSDLAVIDKQLDALRARLTNLSAHYTDRYPDVQSVKEEIGRTEKLRNDLLADLRKKSDASKQPTAGQGGGGISYVQNTPLMQVESQARANELEIANREQAIGTLKVRINQYQARLNNEPAREQELTDLSRGYDQTKAYYNDLLKKKNDSEMATSMEQMQQGERFTMLDPPSLPLKPDFPSRPKFCGIGLAVGLGLGLIVVFLFEVIDDRIYSEKEIQKLLPVSIVTEIPVVTLPSETGKSKRRAVLGWATTAFVVATIVAGTTFSYLHD